MITARTSVTRTSAAAVVVIAGSVPARPPPDQLIVQVMLARNILFTFFICIIPALLPVVALKALHLPASGLGLLYTSMGIGSVFGAIFVIPWARSRLKSNQITILANLLLALVFVQMALVRAHSFSMLTAALAGFEGALPDTYGMKAEALADLMNEYKYQHDLATKDRSP